MLQASLSGGPKGKGNVLALDRRDNIKHIFCGLNHVYRLFMTIGLFRKTYIIQNSDNLLKDTVKCLKV